MSKKNKVVRTEEEKTAKRSAIVKLITLIALTAVIFAFYRYALTTPIFPFVFALYLIGSAVLIFVYIIYNRGMSRKGVTAEMLPDEWSDEQKDDFIEDGKRRLKSSSWMLMLILAFMFTFAFELLELYALPFLENILSA